MMTLLHSKTEYLRSFEEIALPKKLLLIFQMIINPLLFLIQELEIAKTLLSTQDALIGIRKEGSIYKAFDAEWSRTNHQ